MLFFRTFSKYRYFYHDRQELWFGVKTDNNWTCSNLLYWHQYLFLHNIQFLMQVIIQFKTYNLIYANYSNSTLTLQVALVCRNTSQLTLKRKVLTLGYKMETSGSLRIKFWNKLFYVFWWLFKQMTLAIGFMQEFCWEIPSRDYFQNILKNSSRLKKNLGLRNVSKN